MRTPPLFFLDVECLGLDDQAPVWNIAAILINAEGRREWSCDLIVEHSTTTDRIDALPPSFRDDYHRRYTDYVAAGHETVTAGDAAALIWTFCPPGAFVAGSNPAFDMAHLARLMRSWRNLEPRWHYHPFDIPQLALGAAVGALGYLPAGPWKTDYMCRMAGVDPDEFARHTALGDCELMLAVWERLTSRRGGSVR